jgi:hypothetical protein
LCSRAATRCGARSSPGPARPLLASSTIKDLVAGSDIDASTSTYPEGASIWHANHAGRDSKRESASGRRRPTGEPHATAKGPMLMGLDRFRSAMRSGRLGAPFPRRMLWTAMKRGLLW